MTNREDHMTISHVGFAARAAIALSLAIGGPGAPALAKDIVVADAKGETVLETAPRKAAVFDLAALDILNALGVDAVAGVPKGAEGKGNFPPHIAHSWYPTGNLVSKSCLVASGNPRP
jgi:ABC-type Fe3+-hydroxamate transport system substrate-binding protein